MLYIKNINSWERVLRVIVFSLVAGAPFIFTLPYPLLWIITGLSMAVTGIVGWCPACAIAGKKLNGNKE